MFLQICWSQVACAAGRGMCIIMWAREYWSCNSRAGWIRTCEQSKTFLGLNSHAHGDAISWPGSQNPTLGGWSRWRITFGWMPNPFLFQMSSLCCWWNSLVGYLKCFPSRKLCVNHPNNISEKLGARRPLLLCRAGVSWRIYLRYFELHTV